MHSPSIAARRAVLVALGSVALTGCAGVGGATTVTLSQRDIERLLERSFPMQRRVLEVFDVNLQAPRIGLVPARNRVAIEMDFSARERVLSGNWRGQLSFDAMLRWEPADQTLRLAQVRVQDFALDNPSAADRSAAERIVAALAERVLEGATLYRLQPEHAAELQRRGVAPADVTIGARGVEIAFAALPR